MNGLKDDTLYDVEVQNYEEEEPLVADLPFFTVCGSTVLLPVLLFLFSFLFSFLFNPILQTSTITQKLMPAETEGIRIMSTLASISPQNSVLQLFIQLIDFSSPTNKKFTGSFVLTTFGATLNRIIERPFNSSIFQNDGTHMWPVPLFLSNSADFRGANLTLTFDAEPPAKSVSIIWRISDLTTAKFISAVRVSFSLCFVLYFINFSLKLKNEGWNSQKLIQIMTFVLMLLALMHLFPFSYFLGQSSNILLSEKIFKNVFLGYVLFYSLASLTYVIEKPAVTPINWLLFPYFIFVFYSIFWILKDSRLVYPETEYIFPLLSMDDVPDLYYTVSINFYGAILFFWTIGFARKLKDSHIHRFYFYLMVNLYTYGSYLLYLILVQFDTFFTNSALKDTFPYITLSLYALLMAHGQYDTKESTAFKDFGQPLIATPDTMGLTIGVDVEENQAE